MAQDFAATLAEMVARARPQQAPPQRPAQVIPGPMGMGGSASSTNVQVGMDIGKIMGYLGIMTPAQKKEVADGWVKKYYDSEREDQVKMEETPGFEDMWKTVGKYHPVMYREGTKGKMVPYLPKRSREERLKGATGEQISAGIADQPGMPPEQQPSGMLLGAEIKLKQTPNPVQEGLWNLSKMEFEETAALRTLQMRRENLNIQLTLEQLKTENMKREKELALLDIELGDLTGIPPERAKEYVSLARQFSGAWNAIFYKDAHLRSTQPGDRYDQFVKGADALHQFAGSIKTAFPTATNKGEGALRSWVNEVDVERNALFEDMREAGIDFTDLSKADFRKLKPIGQDRLRNLRNLIPVYQGLLDVVRPLHGIMYKTLADYANFLGYSAEDARSFLTSLVRTEDPTQGLTTDLVDQIMLSVYGETGSPYLTPPAPSPETQAQGGPATAEATQQQMTSPENKIKTLRQSLSLMELSGQTATEYYRQAKEALEKLERSKYFPSRLRILTED